MASWILRILGVAFIALGAARLVVALLRRRGDR